VVICNKRLILATSLMKRYDTKAKIHSIINVYYRLNFVQGFNETCQHFCQFFFNEIK